MKTNTLAAIYNIASLASEKGGLRQLCWWRGRREPRKIAKGGYDEKI